jgi:hypothetical protein
VSSLVTACQRLLSFRIQQPPSLLTLRHFRLHSTVHCLTSDSVLDWLYCARARCSLPAFNGGVPLLPGWRPSHASLVPSLQILSCNWLLTATQLFSQDCLTESELLYDWRFTSNQFVLASSLVRLMTRVFLQLNPYGHNPCVASSLLWICLAFPSVHVAPITRDWKFFLLQYMQVLCQSVLFKAGHACLVYLMLQRQLSHFNGPKLDRRQI